MNKKVILTGGVIILMCLITILGTETDQAESVAFPVIYYGGAWYKSSNDIAETVNFALANNYYNMTLNNTGTVYGVTHTGNSNSLIIEHDGMYYVSYMAIGAGASNHIYNAGIAVDSVVYNRTRSTFKTNAAGDIVTMGGMGLLRLYKNNELTLMVRDWGGTGNGYYYGANLDVMRIDR